MGVGIDQQGYGLGGNGMVEIILTCLILWQWRDRRMQHAKPQVLLEKVEVAIAMKELVALLNTECGNQAIDGTPNGNTKPTQDSIIPGRLDGKLIAADFKDRKLVERLQRRGKLGIVANSLQDFGQNQARDPYASNAALPV
jgi:hypothetical protein